MQGTAFAVVTSQVLPVEGCDACMDLVHGSTHGSMRYFSIDPGKTGGWALLHETDEGKSVKMAGPLPMTYEKKYDLKALVMLMRPPYKIDDGCYIVYEKLHAMPMKGSIAAHERGYAQGMIEAMATALRLPLVGVSPQKWQNKMLPADYEDTKKAAVLVAKERFPYIDLSTGKPKVEGTPDLKKKAHQGIVDALLIGEYARLYI